MASNQTAKDLASLNSSGLQLTNPALYQVMVSVINTIDGLSNNVTIIQSVITPTIVSGAAADITGLFVTLGPNEIVFNWDAQGAGMSYEVRAGSLWVTASYVTTTLANNVPINPLVAGTYTYLFKALDSSGHYSPDATSITFDISSPGQVIPTTQVFSNNVLFFWNPPSFTFNIDHYNIYKNSILIGTVTGTFFTYFEITGGTYTYTIQAVDLAGNAGPTGSTVSLILPSPTDYILKAKVIDSPFTGTLVSGEVDPSNGFIIAPIDIVETYQQHFVNNSWATPAAQVAAGYPYFIQPNETPGTYTKVFDFGTTISAVIVNVFYASSPIVGIVTISFTIAVSTDNITYDSPQSGTSRFATSLRYAKVVVTFTSGTDKGLTYLTNLEADLNVHIENDGGNIVALSTDAGGTVVTFNKSFLNVLSITTIVKQTVARTVVIDFDYTLVNPTTFKVLVFDSGGTRQTETVGWASRGILT